MYFQKILNILNRLPNDDLNDVELILKMFQKITERTSGYLSIQLEGLLGSTL